MRTLTKQDVTMFHIMESMKRLSKCIDKQVVCLLVDQNGIIVSSGVNTVLECDKNCHDKVNRKCVVIHAEIMALENLNYKECYKSSDYLTAYVSLFPCKPCQIAIDPYVKEIVTFGMIHKDWVSDKLVVFGHPIYDSVGTYKMDAVSDLEQAVAEKAHSDLFENEIANVVKQRAYPDFYATLNRVAFQSFKKLLEDTGKNGLIAYTKSNYIKH